MVATAVRTKRLSRAIKTLLRQDAKALSNERVRYVREETYQQCGGGRRLIRKSLSGH